VSKKGKYNDFCFWNQRFDNVTAATANPHQTTRIEGIATWGCRFDAAGDGTTWEDAYPLFQEHGESKFEYLRCRAVGVDIEQSVFKSDVFWYSLLTFSFIIIIFESLYFRLHFWKSSSITTDCTCNSLDNVEQAPVCEESTGNECSIREPIALQRENCVKAPHQKEKLEMSILLENRLRQKQKKSLTATRWEEMLGLILVEN